MNDESDMRAALFVARGLHFAATAIVWGGGGLLCLLPFRDQSRTLTGVRRAALVAGVSGLGWFVATFVVVTGDVHDLVDPEALLAFWTSAFGPPWAIHVALTAGCVTLGLLKPSSPALVGLVLSGGALAINQAWLGHAATGTGQAGAMGLATQAIHITAAYAWVGALPVLILLIREGDGPRVVQALALFSTIGMLVVATILATGVVNVATRLQAPAQLMTTPYGRIISIKIGLVAAMIALAWANRLDVRRTVPPRRRITLEMILGAVTLGAAALLGMSAPPG